MASESPLPAFRFQTRRGKLDWRSVSSLDLDRVMRDVDIDSLEAQLAGVAFADVSREDFRWFSETDFLQLFRLQQLIAEYLLYVQETLHRRNVTLEGAVGVAQAQLQDQAEYIGVLEAQLRLGGGGGVGSAKRAAHTGGHFRFALSEDSEGHVCIGQVLRSEVTDDRAKLKVGDRVESIDGVQIKERSLSLADAKQLIRAASDSLVIEVSRAEVRPASLQAHLRRRHPGQTQQQQTRPVATVPETASPPAKKDVVALPPAPPAAPAPTPTAASSAAVVAPLDDGTIQKALAEVRQSVRDELAQELPDLRASLEKELNTGLRESLASSVKEHIAPVLAAQPRDAQAAPVDGILSEQIQLELREQTGALKAQMDGLQDQLAKQRAELEDRMSQAARDAAVAGANAGRESAMAGAADAGAANEAAQMAKKQAMAAEEAARSATVIATEAAREAATHAAREAASKAASEAAREAAQEAATQVAQIVAAEATREALAEASLLAGSVARSEASAVLAASKQAAAAGSSDAPPKASLLGGELLDFDDDIEIDEPLPVAPAPKPVASASTAPPAKAPVQAASTAPPNADMARTLTQDANEFLAEVDASKAATQPSNSSASDFAQAVTDAYHAMDIDNSGSLTPGEVMRACREQERVRLLLGMPRNIGDSDGSLDSFRALFAQLDADGSQSISLKEFVDFFTSKTTQESIAAAFGAPSWTALVASNPLEVDGDPAVRAENGYLHWQSQARFAHTRERWLSEHADSRKTVFGELENWNIPKDRQTLTKEESVALIQNQRAVLNSSSPFSPERRAAQREKVEQMLSERMRLGYKQPTPEQLSKLEYATQIDPPLEVLTTPREPH